MKKIILLFLIVSTSIVAQKIKSTSLGRATVKELRMTSYEKDTTANAVVLREHANLYAHNYDSYYTVVDYYYRVKIFNKSALDLATVTINLFGEQKFRDLQAITYNISGKNITKSRLSDDDVITVKKDKDWTTKKFTMANVKEGSVIEYKYSILSPYFNINNWYFQSNIPKIKSEYDAAIVANYKFDLKLIGPLKLDKNESSTKKNCIVVDGIGMRPCAIYSFGMEDIPAFKEDSYMLSKNNYVSQIAFHLKYFVNTNGVKNKYTTTWRYTDIKLKNLFFNNQNSKIRFFDFNLPKKIIATKNKLERAKKVYSFIQKHYNWNKKNWTDKKTKVKQAFNKKTGDVAQINVSLYNSLMAANVDATLVVLSTRDNGIPTKLHPVIYDFNYVIAKTNINGKDYYLDATDKFLSFGQVPVRTLNAEARVLDLENESYWTVLGINENSSLNVRSKLILNKNGTFKGNITSKKTGYLAISQREKIETLTKENYLKDIATESPDLNVENYQVNNLKNLDKPLLEIFDIKLNSNEDLNNIIKINPFFFERLKTNPFKLKKRNYPVDFAYPWKSNYALKIEVPTNYKITKTPKNFTIQLPNKAGLFVLEVQQNNNSIVLYTRLDMNKKTFTSEEYSILKDFFKQVIIAQNNDITIEKLIVN